MSLPPSSAPTATGWSDSCRAGFAPAEEWRLVTAHLKDEFGGRHVRVRSASKVMCHCMFGVLALIADQLVRLVT